MAAGVDVTRYKLWAFALSGFLAGTSGALLAGSLGRLDARSFIAGESILLFCLAIVGGAYHWLGALFAGVLFKLLPTLFNLPDPVIGLIGPNGAGKSELAVAVALAGVFAYEGDVTLGDRQLTGEDAREIRAAGIAAVPEGHPLLTGLSVLDNLRAAGSMHTRPELDSEVDKALSLLPELNRLSGNRVGSLSGGQQQMLAIAQALISRPRFLALDEMSLGLAPIIVERLVDVVRDLRSNGIGILLHRAVHSTSAGTGRLLSRAVPWTLDVFGRGGNTCSQSGCVITGLSGILIIYSYSCSPRCASSSDFSSLSNAARKLLRSLSLRHDRISRSF